MTKKEEKAMQAQAQAQSTAMQNEVIDLLLHRAGLKKQDIYRVALRRWAVGNLDLLTPAEVKKYKPVLSL